jgi:signal transduction histidine kinase
VQSLEYLQPPQNEETGLRYQRIRRSVGRISSLVKQFLVTDQITENHRLSVNRLLLDGADIARQALNCNEVAIGRVTLKTSDTMPCWGDPALVQVALTNLLDNALKYSPPDSPVEFQVEAMTRQGVPGVAWTVADQGIGIAPENRGTVFDKYERGVDHGNVSGTGLGLYLVQRIAQLHGGNVEILDREGWGAVLRLWLPQEGEAAC